MLSRRVRVEEEADRAELLLSTPQRSLAAEIESAELAALDLVAQGERVARALNLSDRSPDVLNRAEAYLKSLVFKEGSSWRGRRNLWGLETYIGETLELIHSARASSSEDEILEIRRRVRRISKLLNLGSLLTRNDAEQDEYALIPLLSSLDEDRFSSAFNHAMFYAQFRAQLGSDVFDELKDHISEGASPRTLIQLENEFEQVLAERLNNIPVPPPFRREFNRRKEAILSNRNTYQQAEQIEQLLRSVHAAQTAFSISPSFANFVKPFVFTSPERVLEVSSVAQVLSTSHFSDIAKDYLNGKISREEFESRLLPLLKSALEEQNLPIEGNFQQLHRLLLASKQERLRDLALSDVDNVSYYVHANELLGSLPSSLRDSAESRFRSIVSSESLDEGLKFLEAVHSLEGLGIGAAVIRFWGDDEKIQSLMNYASTYSQLEPRAKRLLKPLLLRFNSVAGEEFESLLSTFSMASSLVSVGIFTSARRLIRTSDPVKQKDIFESALRKRFSQYLRYFERRGVHIPEELHTLTESSLNARSRNQFFAILRTLHALRGMPHVSVEHTERLFIALIQGDQESFNNSINSILSENVNANQQAERRLLLTSFRSLEQRTLAVLTQFVLFDVLAPFENVDFSRIPSSERRIAQDLYLRATQGRLGWEDLIRYLPQSSSAHSFLKRIAKHLNAGRLDLARRELIQFQSHLDSLVLTLGAARGLRNMPPSLIFSAINTRNAHALSSMESGRLREQLSSQLRRYRSVDATLVSTVQVNFNQLIDQYSDALSKGDIERARALRKTIEQRTRRVSFMLGRLSFWRSFATSSPQAARSSQFAQNLSTLRSLILKASEEDLSRDAISSFGNCEENLYFEAAETFSNIFNTRLVVGSFIRMGSALAKAHIRFLRNPSNSRNARRVLRISSFEQRLFSTMPLLAEADVEDVSGSAAYLQAMVAAYEKGLPVSKRFERRLRSRANVEATFDRIFETSAKLVGYGVGFALGPLGLPLIGYLTIDDVAQQIDAYQLARTDTERFMSGLGIGLSVLGAITAFGRVGLALRGSMLARSSRFGRFFAMRGEVPYASMSFRKQLITGLWGHSAMSRAELLLTRTDALQFFAGIGMSVYDYSRSQGISRGEALFNLFVNAIFPGLQMVGSTYATIRTMRTGPRSRSISRQFFDALILGTPFEFVEHIYARSSADPRLGPFVDLHTTNSLPETLTSLYNGALHKELPLDNVFYAYVLRLRGEPISNENLHSLRSQFSQFLETLSTSTQSPELLAHLHEGSQLAQVLFLHSQNLASSSDVFAVARRIFISSNTSAVFERTLFQGNFSLGLNSRAALEQTVSIFQNLGEFIFNVNDGESYVGMVSFDLVSQNRLNSFSSDSGQRGLGDINMADYLVWLRNVPDQLNRRLKEAGIEAHVVSASFGQSSDEGGLLVIAADEQSLRSAHEIVAQEVAEYNSDLSSLLEAAPASLRPYVQDILSKGRLRMGFAYEPFSNSSPMEIVHRLYRAADNNQTIPRAENLPSFPPATQQHVETAAVMPFSDRVLESQGEAQIRTSREDVNRMLSEGDALLFINANVVFDASSPDAARLLERAREEGKAYAQVSAGLLTLSVANLESHNLGDMLIFSLNRSAQETSEAMAEVLRSISPDLAQYSDSVSVAINSAGVLVVDLSAIPSEHRDAVGKAIARKYSEILSSFLAEGYSPLVQHHLSTGDHTRSFASFVDFTKMENIYNLDNSQAIYEVSQLPLNYPEELRKRERFASLFGLWCRMQNDPLFEGILSEAFTVRTGDDNVDYLPSFLSFLNEENISIRGFSDFYVAFHEWQTTVGDSVGTAIWNSLINSNILDRIEQVYAGPSLVDALLTVAQVEERQFFKELNNAIYSGSIPERFSILFRSNADFISFRNYIVENGLEISSRSDFLKAVRNWSGDSLLTPRRVRDAAFLSELSKHYPNLSFQSLVYAEGNSYVLVKVKEGTQQFPMLINVSNLDAFQTLHGAVAEVESVRLSFSYALMRDPGYLNFSAVEQNFSFDNVRPELLEFSSMGRGSKRTLILAELLLRMSEGSLPIPEAFAPLVRRISSSGESAVLDAINAALIIDSYRKGLPTFDASAYFNLDAASSDDLRRYADFFRWAAEGPVLFSDRELNPQSLTRFCNQMSKKHKKLYSLLIEQHGFSQEEAHWFLSNYFGQGLFLAESSQESTTVFEELVSAYRNADVEDFSTVSLLRLWVENNFEQDANIILNAPNLSFNNIHDFLVLRSLSSIYNTPHASSLFGGVVVSERAFGKFINVLYSFARNNLHSFNFSERAEHVTALFALRNSPEYSLPYLGPFIREHLNNDAAPVESHMLIENVLREDPETRQFLVTTYSTVRGRFSPPAPLDLLTALARFRVVLNDGSKPLSRKRFKRFNFGQAELFSATILSRRLAQLPTNSPWSEVLKRMFTLPNASDYTTLFNTDVNVLYLALELSRRDPSFRFNLDQFPQNYGQDFRLALAKYVASRLNIDHSRITNENLDTVMRSFAYLGTLHMVEDVFNAVSYREVDMDNSPKFTLNQIMLDDVLSPVDQSLNIAPHLQRARALILDSLAHSLEGTFEQHRVAMFRAAYRNEDPAVLDLWFFNRLSGRNVVIEPLRGLGALLNFGRELASSCQAFNNPSSFSVSLGSIVTNPWFQPVIISENGRAQSRALLMFVRDENGDPAVIVQPPYGERSSWNAAVEVLRNHFEDQGITVYDYREAADHTFVFPGSTYPFVYADSHARKIGLAYTGLFAVQPGVPFILNALD